MIPFKVVNGCPQLKVYDDGIVISSSGKPLKFSGYGESTTLVIGGKICRVKKRDIIYCANTGDNLALFNRGKAKRCTYKGVTLCAMRRYEEAIKWQTLCVVAIRERDATLLYNYLLPHMERCTQHMQRVSGVDYDDAKDAVLNALMRMCDMIKDCKIHVYAPLSYILRMVKSKKI